MNRVFAMMGRREQVGDDDEGEKKLELLRAVRLSQTRAREAEKRSDSLGKEKDCLSNALLGQSLQLSAYRRWARLLEAHILKLEAELKDGATKSCSRCTSGGDDDDDDDAGERMPWLVAIAFCFGAGIVLGFTYWFSD
ncbi:unnamed protein product [Linum tenue]|uniref:Uncharacterized protein n=1 Tax=Linum tenue TaxID=586396 RepID=A0AAV0KJ43_9ROSI|nr:unnamed protein product [Linum tenue]